MILARTERDGMKMFITLGYGRGCCWLNSYRNTEWASASVSMRWTDGSWLVGERWTPDSGIIVAEKPVTPSGVMAKVLGTFGVLDDFSLFDTRELERLLSPDSMVELSLALEVMGS